MFTGKKAIRNERVLKLESEKSKVKNLFYSSPVGIIPLFSTIRITVL